MEEIISKFVNEIKDYIANDNVNKFKKTVKRFEKENEINLNIEWDEKAPNALKKKKKIPADIEKRLFETIKIKEIKDFEVDEESSNDEIVEICNKILNYLDDIEKKNNSYYYNLGMLLLILKGRSASEKMFLAFAKDEFNRSKSTINNYIRFYNVCNEYSNLIKCNLSYREIITYITEITEILDHRDDQA